MILVNDTWSWYLYDKLYFKYIIRILLSRMDDEIIAGTESEPDSPVQPRFQRFLTRESKESHAHNVNTSIPASNGQAEHVQAAHGATMHYLAPAVGSCQIAPPVMPPVKIEDNAWNNAEAVLRMRSAGPVVKTEVQVNHGYELVPVKREAQEHCTLDDDDLISESSEDSLDDIDDKDWMMEEDETDIRAQVPPQQAPQSMAAGLRSLLPDLPHQPHRHSGHGLRQDEGAVKPWWLLLPDFVPVKELSRGIDPRNASKVHVLYEKQFTAESSSAHSRDKDKNLGPDGSSGLLYDDLAASGGREKKTKKRRVSEGSGSWYYSEGKKVFRDAQGNELTGKSAWRAYKGGCSGKAKKKRSFKRGAGKARAQGD